MSAGYHERRLTGRKPLSSMIGAMDASAQIVSKIQIGRSSQSLSGRCHSTDCLHVLEEEVNGRQAVCFWKVCGLPGGSCRLAAAVGAGAILTMTQTFNRISRPQGSQATWIICVGVT